MKKLFFTSGVVLVLSLAVLAFASTQKNNNSIQNNDTGLVKKSAVGQQKQAVQKDIVVKSTETFSKSQNEESKIDPTPESLPEVKIIPGPHRGKDSDAPTDIQSLK